MAKCKLEDPLNMSSEVNKKNKNNNDTEKLKDITNVMPPLADSNTGIIQTESPDREESVSPCKEENAEKTIFLKI
ncbi:5421_t:CDS:2 [Gigaspora margarita]|uniref:5421_t:CDS:1 n=1 Tax=Gigaspora margarita TaxID=4874 RepID=A0ABN7UE96_GIGMA|nr:5421_t:CDS:2 [Gigaspora margarita]